MQIITQILTIFNGLNNIFIHGPQEIPEWHELYGKKYYRCGTYTRSLLLFDRVKVTFIIYRFYDPMAKRTYSLLPFYISPYQRHINTTIDLVLFMYFFQGKSFFSISVELDIGIETVRRRIQKFAARTPDIMHDIEKKLISERPGYRPASNPLYGIFDTVRIIIKNVCAFIQDKNFILDYGFLSWININFGV
jgi:hypothetical protein